MTDKISPIKVIKEAIRIYREHLKASLIYGVLPALLFLPQFFWNKPLIDAQESVPPTAFVLIGMLLFVVIFLALVLVYYVSILNFGVTSLRGRPTILPKQPVKRVFSFLGRGILIYLEFLPIVFAIALPVSLATLIDPYFPQWVSIGLMVLIVTAGGLLSMTYLLRMSLQFPAAAVGDKTSFKLSWRMAKGHTLRLLASMLLLSIPPMLIMGLAMTVLFIFGTLPAEMGQNAIPSIFMFLVATAMLMNSLLVPLVAYTLCIWYEALRRRYEAMDPVVKMATMGPE